MKSSAEYKQLALEYAGKGQHERVIACCSEWIRQDPKSPIAYLLRGGSYVSIGDGVRGLADMERGKAMMKSGMHQ